MNTTQSPNEGKNGSPVWGRVFHNMRAWFERQGNKRLSAFVIASLIYEAFLAFILYHVKHHPQSMPVSTCLGVVSITVLFFSVLWMVCFPKKKKTDVGGRKVGRLTLLCWWGVTIWMTLFFAVPHTAQAASTSGGTTVTQSAQVDQTTASPSSGPQPKVSVCFLLWLTAFLIILGIAVWLIMAICRAAGICGGNGAPPPPAPGNGGAGANIAQHVKFNANISSSISTNLPVTVFYLQNGQVISNSAGLKVSSMPSLFSLNGVPVPNGSQLGAAVPPGISSPPSIALWTETNTFSDAILDPTHPYQVIYNYSLLSTTNLLGNWHEVCTVVGWINNNPTVPLIASIIYTNGVPETTNWTQIYLDSHLQPTNIVVYGTLSSSSDPATVQQFAPHDLTPPGPGSGGSGFTNAAPIDSKPTFLKMTCNTNALSTSWP